MTLRINKVDVWAAEIDDKPGGLARVMRALADAGINLEGVLARRDADKTGKGVVFVKPRGGREHLKRAEEAGLRPTHHVPTLKVEGIDHQGLGAELTQAIAEAGINMHGLTASVIGRKFVCFVGFDSAEDLEGAQNALMPLTKWHWPTWHKTAKRKTEATTGRAA